MKETAVEWLVYQIFNDVDLKDSILKLAIQQAKQIEKQQIIDAWDDGYIGSYDDSSTPEEYYNQTFKSE